MANFILSLAACTAPRSISPATARQILADAWQANQHAVWEIEWPAAPLTGPVTVETWRTGQRYRYEILEASAPALVGQTLVFNGQTAWQYNRLDPPPLFTPASPVLSPVTEAFVLVERLVNTPASSATQESVPVNGQAAQKITLTFANGDTLALWQATESGLPLKVQFWVNGQLATLTARTVEPLPHPPDKLFTVGDWLRDVP